MSFSPTVDLAVVIPALEERGNILPVLKRLAEALEGIRYEVVFVDDDSLDGTADLVRIIANTDPKVHVIQRVHRRGRASACVEGMLSTAAPCIAVMDADRQHDERLLPNMLRRLQCGSLDVVVGSRHSSSGSMGQLSSWRTALTKLKRRLAAVICHCPVQDPLSGFFVLRREFFMETVHRLSGLASKILLDLLASAPGKPKICELPYFVETQAQGRPGLAGGQPCSLGAGEYKYGQRKLGRGVACECFQLVLDKLIGNLIPPPFVIFALVGAVGVAVHVGAFTLALFGLRLRFDIAQAVAALAAMTLNFFLNNAITFRSARLKGRRLLGGLASFYAVCSIGMWINLKVAFAAGALGGGWYIAGLTGLGVGSIWNYGVTQIFTWQTDRKRLRRDAPKPAYWTAAEATYEDSISLRALAEQLDLKKESMPVRETSNRIDR